MSQVSWPIRPLSPCRALLTIAPKICREQNCRLQSAVAWVRRSRLEHRPVQYVSPELATLVLEARGFQRSLRRRPNLARTGNHTGYRQWTGSRVSAEEITDLYQGLKQSYLDDFDMMLSGYVPGAAALEAVGQIGQELKQKAKSKPGSFFWVLDPVMGDNGNLYVAADVVPVYRSLVHHADLVLPNQFEAE